MTFKLGQRVAVQDLFGANTIGFGVYGGESQDQHAWKGCHKITVGNNLVMNIAFERLEDEAEYIKKIKAARQEVRLLAIQGKPCSSK